MSQNWQVIHADISLKYFLFQFGDQSLLIFVPDELRPCIFHQTAKNIKNCDAGYPVIIHEAPTNGKTKQLDVITRYGRNERKQVVSK